ncbi:MAG: asparagine synthase (glutamine-hydrolyzing) [Bacteroidetes bacterium]|nr:asparagine synthase (glutamine-hydrolyzing) [Bacteroidota bacterium]HET6243366.1 asparagine synthase (glutamine-hydrolyzing) [Bacteroidia bacterium]
MCGINGIYSHNGATECFPILNKMNDTLSHRGPDDNGVFTEGPVALGHCRLSIIDLSSAGHQPMSYANKRFTVVFNGEIYNYKELREELRKTDNSYLAETFTTNTDTEVLLAAFKRWGKNCVNKFNGMFAFSLWDSHEKELFIARDRLGIKPLYYFKDEKKLIFSSEIRPLLNTGLIPLKLNRSGLIDYLRYQTVHAPFTIVENIFMLLPGHHITINEEDFSIKKYWDIVEEALEEKIPFSYEDVCKKTKQLLFESVERRLVADVPFGAFLSGGIDSSAVVGIMTEVSEQKVNTFNVSFDEQEFSEAKYAALIAKKFKTNHHEIKLSPSDFLKNLPLALSSLDHPSGDGPNTWIVSKVTKEAGITMALSGLGGDELFAGYDIFKQMYKLRENRWLLSFPMFSRTLAGFALKSIKPGVASDKTAEILKQDYFDISTVYPLYRQVLLDKQIYKLLKGSSLPPNKVAEMLKSTVEFESEGFALPSMGRISVAEIYTYMQNVLLRDADQMSMAHALEVRVPFLDYNLVKFVLAVPDEYKYPHTPKKLLTDSLNGLLPSDIVNRPKMGFTFPWKHWMKNELREFCESKLKSLSSRDGINPKEVNFLWQQFLKDNPRITWSRIWYLVVLENWLIENKIT